MSQPVRGPGGAVLMHFECRRACLIIEEREAGGGARLMDREQMDR